MPHMIGGNPALHSEESSVARQRHLNKAPILEAILNIRVVPRNDAKFEDLMPLESALAPRYRKSGEKRNTDLTLKVTADGSEPVVLTRNPSLVGLMFSSEDDQYRVQTAATEFTQNVLRPYPDFETLVDEAKGNWEKYKAATRPLSISRIAL